MISVVIVSKDEPALDSTLSHVEAQLAELRADGLDAEVLVVDASQGRLDDVRRRHLDVRWFDYRPAEGSGVTIAHQRNVGVREARGEVLVFTDSGCSPQPGWLRSLVAAILAGTEQVVAGATVSADPGFRLYGKVSAAGPPSYVEECPTINVALRRAVVDEVGGFDESFRYGSDVDLSWRLRDRGYRILRQPAAVVESDWGDWRRQVRRSFAYGRARVHLYRRHPDRIPRILRDDPVVVVWPLFLLGLPIALKRPSYLLLLAVPAWRARHDGPVRVIVDHAVYGAGVLTELVRQ